MIRRITPDDKETYLELTDHFYHSEAVLHPVPLEYRLATWEELLRSDDYLDCLFLEEDGKVLGFLLLAYTFSQEAGGKVAWIEEIYIEPPYRCKGYGRQFFAWIEAEIEPRCKRIRLEVEPENARAKRLYASLGYRPLPYEQMLKGR